MVNKNYKRGRDAEYECMQQLREEGFTAFRTAGSHGMFDVIAVNDTIIRLIQVERIKKGKSTRKTRDWKTIQNFKNCPPGTFKELWIKVDYDGWRYHVCSRGP